jgi:hypothetical protein
VLTDGKRLEIACFVACPSGVDAGMSVRAQAPDEQQNQEKK